MIINTKQFWNWWTEELRAWFTSKFSPLATESNVNAKSTALSNKLDTMSDAMAKDATVAKNATVAKEATLTNATNGLAAIKGAVDLIPTTEPATPQNVTDAKNAIIAALPDDYATSTQASGIANKIGTPTAGSTNDTLFKAIEHISIPDDVARRGTDTDVTLTTLQEDIAAIPTTPISDYAKQSTLTNLLPLPILKLKDVGTTIQTEYVYDGSILVSLGRGRYMRYYKWIHGETIKYTNVSEPNASSTIYKRNENQQLVVDETVEFILFSYPLLHDSIAHVKAETDLIGSPASGSTNTTLFQAVENINVDTSTLAQRTDVKDGNDTAISIGKAIKAVTDTFTEATVAEIDAMWAPASFSD